MRYAAVILIALVLAVSTQAQPSPCVNPDTGALYWLIRVGSDPAEYLSCPSDAPPIPSPTPTPEPPPYPVRSVLLPVLR